MCCMIYVYILVWAKQLAECWKETYRDQVGLVSFCCTDQIRSY